MSRNNHTQQPGNQTGGMDAEKLQSAESTGGPVDSAEAPIETTNNITTNQTGGDGGDCPGNDAMGNVSQSPVAPLQPVVAPTRETRAQAANRWTREGRRDEVDRRKLQLIRQGRLAGLTKRMAGEAAWLAVMAEFPPPGVESVQAESPPADVPPANSADPEAGRLVGLADLPASWPPLPPNAPLQAEIQWVQAVRIDVVEALQSGGYRIRLECADSPAPSKASLSWLETAVLFPAKFADVAVKTTAALEDDREAVRRERRSIEDVRSILAEMRVAKAENPR